MRSVVEVYELSALANTSERKGDENRRGLRENSERS